MRTVYNTKEIRKLHLSLEQSLDKYVSEKILFMISHRGGTIKKRIKYSEELDMWWEFAGYAGEEPNQRYWNAFGPGKPEMHEVRNITCEINYPKTGINNKVAARWVEDNGSYYLIHSGKIGGGRSGIGPSLFHNEYEGDIIELNLEGYQRKFAPIGEISNPRLPYQLKFFVDEVERMKLKNENKTLKPADTSGNETNYNDEFFGTTTGKRAGGSYLINCDHGIIVKELRNQLNLLGMRADNNRECDLFIKKNNSITTLFEVKTVLNTQTLYTAVGQLLVNAAKLEKTPKMVFVSPDIPKKKLTQVLDKLKINILVYGWNKDKPVFQNLNTIL